MNYYDPAQYIPQWNLDPLKNARMDANPMGANSNFGYGFDSGPGRFDSGQNYLPQQGGGLGSALDTAGNASFLANPWLGIGLKGVGFLAKALKPDPYKKYRDQGIASLQGMLGQNPIDVNRFQQMYYQNYLPQIKANAQTAANHFGVNQPDAFNYLLGQTQENLAGNMRDLTQQNAQMKSQRDMQIAQYLAGYRG